MFRKFYGHFFSLEVWTTRCSFLWRHNIFSSRTKALLSRTYIADVKCWHLWRQLLALVPFHSEYDVNARLDWRQTISIWRHSSRSINSRDMQDSIAPINTSIRSSQTTTPVTNKSYSLACSTQEPLLHLTSNIKEQPLYQVSVYFFYTTTLW